MEEALGNLEAAAVLYEQAVEGWTGYGHQLETGIALLGASRCRSGLGAPGPHDHDRRAEEIFAALGAVSPGSTGTAGGTAAMSDDGWIPLVTLDDVPDRKPIRVDAHGADVLLVRNGDELFAIGNRCSHQGAPLHKGPVRFGGSLRTVQCPLHGSTFDLAQGKVLRGPATEPVPAYETRVTEGVVEIRPR